MEENKTSILFEKAQENGKYLVFAFRLDNQEELKLEVIRGRLYCMDLLRNIAIKISKTNEALHDSEFLSDEGIYVVTVNAKLMNATTIYKIFADEKKKLDISKNFKKVHAYYETDSYMEIDNKYYRGDCLQYVRRVIKEK